MAGTMEGREHEAKPGRVRRPKEAAAPKRARAASKRKAPAGLSPAHAALLEETRAAGLLDGEKSEHVSFRAPPALVEAAKQAVGAASTTELGLLALALLARPDPVAAFFRRTEGRLGKDHTLEF